jgi:hypothetical protein
LVERKWFKVNWAKFVEQMQTMGVRGHKTKPNLESGTIRWFTPSKFTILLALREQLTQTTSMVDNNKVSRIKNDGQLKKKLKTTSAWLSITTPPKMWNVKEILDAKTIMVA